MIAMSRETMLVGSPGGASVLASRSPCPVAAIVRLRTPLASVLRPPNFFLHFQFPLLPSSVVHSPNVCFLLSSFLLSSGGARVLASRTEKSPSPIAQRPVPLTPCSLLLGSGFGFPGRAPKNRCQKVSKSVKSCQIVSNHHPSNPSSPGSVVTDNPYTSI